jgi:hypothetical protein
VGRLSIRIPWKNLGLNPIIIILEDVFVSASQRDDQEVRRIKLHLFCLYNKSLLFLAFCFSMFCFLSAICISGVWTQLKEENLLEKRLNLLQLNWQSYLGAYAVSLI